MRFFITSIILISLFLFGCNGKSSSTSLASVGTGGTKIITPTLKAPEEMMKDLTTLSASTLAGVSELEKVIQSAHPEKVKITAIEKLSSSSTMKATQALKWVWNNSTSNLLKTNALRSLVKQNTESSRNVLLPILQGEKHKIKILIINLIGFYGYLQSKSLLDVVLQDKDKTVSDLAKTTQNKLNKT